MDHGGIADRNYTFQSLWCHPVRLTEILDHGIELPHDSLLKLSDGERILLAMLDAADHIGTIAPLSIQCRSLPQDRFVR